VAGKTETCLLSEDQLEDYQELFDNHRRLKELVHELEERLGHGGEGPPLATLNEGVDAWRFSRGWRRLGHLGRLVTAKGEDLEPAARGGETPRQLPALERAGEIDGTRLAFEQGQVVHRIEARVLGAPVPGMPGDHLGPTDDGHLFDPADHAHLVMGVGGRHRVVVAVETDQ